LLESKANLLQLRQEIPLNETEVAPVDEGIAAMEDLLGKLADIPTPAGPTPREPQSKHAAEAETVRGVTISAGQKR
jgi:hypothetical protein